MNFQSQSIVSNELSKLSADALLVIVNPTTESLEGATWPEALKELWQDALKEGDLENKTGQTLYLHRPKGLQAKRLVLAVAAEPSLKAFKKALHKGLKHLKQRGGKSLLIATAGMPPWSQTYAETVARSVMDSSYEYHHTKPSAKPTSSWQQCTIAATPAELPAVDNGLRLGQAISAGIEVAREQANRPANYCTPKLLAKTAQQLAKEHNFKIEVLDRPELEKLGMGSFLSVTQGSEEPPRFIILRYEGASKKQAPIVLVGKAVTFDSGGISIKPGAGMDEMKFDMAGGASVLGTFRAIAELRPKINLIGLIPATENMPSGKATKPGDVVTSLSGQTIEVLNTDAEGRLILCDALTYAERFNPAVVIDIATLTGACVIALGHHHTGMFSSSDKLAADLLEAGQLAQDTAWRMPLDEEYEDALKSHFADIANVGGRAAGSITGAIFLKKFSQAYPWAHLDIAGTAWHSGSQKGATGRPVALLTHFLLAQQAAQPYTSNLAQPTPPAKLGKSKSASIVKDKSTTQAKP